MQLGHCFHSFMCDEEFALPAGHVVCFASVAAAAVPSCTAVEASSEAKEEAHMCAARRSRCSSMCLHAVACRVYRNARHHEYKHHRASTHRERTATLELLYIYSKAESCRAGDASSGTTSSTSEPMTPASTSRVTVSRAACSEVSSAFAGAAAGAGRSSHKSKPFMVAAAFICSSSFALFALRALSVEDPLGHGDPAAVVDLSADFTRESALAGTFSTLALLLAFALGTTFCEEAAPLEATSAMASEPFAAATSPFAWRFFWPSGKCGEAAPLEARPTSATARMSEPFAAAASHLSWRFF